MSLSRDYKDYVFKEGKFIGHFDEMYRNASEIPWHQDQTAGWLLSDITLAVVRRFKPERFLELGCGLGYFTARVRAEGPQNARLVAGVDISQAAIASAREMHSGVAFACANVLSPADTELVIEEMGGPFQMVLSKELIWYIIDDLEQFMTNLTRMIAPGGMIYISQTFPESTPFYGMGQFPDARAMSDFFSRRYIPLYESIERDAELGNREMLHFVGRSKEDGYVL